MEFKNGIENVHAAAYNGASTVKVNINLQLQESWIDFTFIGYLIATSELF